MSLPFAPFRPARRRRFPLILYLSAALFCLVLLAALILPRFLPAAPLPPQPDDVPAWVEEELLPVNEYSRPGQWLEAINGVVIHYVGNPGTTALQNRNYFAGLARSGETYASSNFIIGLEGEVLLCVPVNEVAYASNTRNNDTLSIEVCHPDEDGVFTDESYAALLRLVQWAVDTYGLDRTQIIRHYDITGKECPRWFVQCPDAWEDFLDELTFP